MTRKRALERALERLENELIDYRKIYETQAENYDKLVSREDYQGNLLPALVAIRPLIDISVVELGAGTGRLTQLLSPHVSHIVAADFSRHMLDRAGKRLADIEPSKYALIQAESRSLPLAGVRVDLALAGWTIGHLVGWHPENWMHQVDAALTEMERILKPGGTSIVLETLGTGEMTPNPPTAALAAYYAHLENKRSYANTWIRTDYLFKSKEEAVALTRFFFGQDLSNRIANWNSPIVPECTGIWWKNP